MLILCTYSMKKIITTDKAPAPIGPYNQAVLHGATLYISGQIPMDPGTGTIVAKAITDQAKQVMENLKAILTEAGMTFENIVKTTIFLSDMEDFGNVNTVYGSYFTDATAPARETVAAKTLPKNVNVEISAIAVRG